MSTVYVDFYYFSTAGSANRRDTDSRRTKAGDGAPVRRGARTRLGPQPRPWKEGTESPSSWGIDGPGHGRPISAQPTTSSGTPFPPSTDPPHGPVKSVSATLFLNGVGEEGESRLMGSVRGLSGLSQTGRRDGTGKGKETGVVREGTTGRCFETE